MKKERMLCGILAAMLLAGCHSYQLDDLSAKLNSIQPSSANYHNLRTSYFSLYCQPSIGIYHKYPLGLHLNDEGIEMVMQIRTHAIVHEDSSLKAPLTSPTHSVIGVYSSLDEIYNYRLDIYAYTRHSLIFFQSDNFYIVSYAPSVAVERMAVDMMRIAQSVVVDTDKVINDYRIDPKITYQTDSLELFETLIPESGTIEEIITKINDETQVDISN